MKYSIDEQLKSEIVDLKSRALKIGYKNAFPRLPKEQANHKTFENLMIGFSKRLHNWKNGLIQLENPGGTLNGKKRDADKIIENNFIDYRQSVMSSFEELENLTEEIG